jgi:hypothetical protein
MSTTQFTARIRWQCDANPCFELETRHTGFATAEEAALFANGFSEAAAAELQLARGQVLFTRVDGSESELERDAITVWHLPDDGQDFQVADDEDFEVVPLSFAAMSAMGLDGGFLQIKYGVLGRSQEVVDVAVEINETGLPEVTVHESDEDVGEAASFSFSIIARG